MPRFAFLAVASLLMLAPALAHLAGVQGAPPANENRRLANPPERPRTVHDLLKLPGQVDAYLNDHFGLRRLLIETNNRIRYGLFGTLDVPQLTAGKNGHIYFNSHNAQEPLAMVHFLCGVGVTPSWIAEATDKIGTFIQQAVQQHAASTLLIVPTKPALYPEHMPDWLQEQCRRGQPPVPQVIGRLRENPRVAPHVQYPYEQMMSMKASLDVYPKENFHWSGEAPRRVAERLSETSFGLPKLVDLPEREMLLPSDMQPFVPGVPLSMRSMVPDHGAVGVTACFGASCFPEWSESAAKLADVSRYRSTRPGGPKLLLISDSFGSAISGYFSEYFGEVWHLSTNNISRLTPEERQKLKNTLFVDYAPDRVLYVYHDFAVRHLTLYLNLLGVGNATN